MATVGDVIQLLEKVSHEYDHYLVGEAPDRSEDIIRSWVVGVSYDSDFILQVSWTDIQDEDKAISVAELRKSFLSLSPNDGDPVELGIGGGEGVRVDFPIVGAELIHEKEILLFYAWNEKKT